ncbi:carbon storage regulator [Desulfocucumis palustris]|uniref:Translational regulator CsrA n=1 Tax=Desulfocucumis palustris TaxID=1898651 RepID=A0A2L2X7Z1_9FIRM|nr:carbon storage regulator CsrA [Desulfocucumis palustris]GBF32285.1 carbon storage regulator [Desulfocucumis palustris]
MLVLTRKKNQGIMLGDNISVVILEIKDDVVKIGIEAPKDTIILRSELYKSVTDENITAVSTGKSAAEMLMNIMSKKK